MLTRRGPLTALVSLWAAAAIGAPYQRTHSETTGVCLAWSVRDYYCYLSGEGSQQIKDSVALQAAIDRSLASWQIVSNVCSDFKFARANVNPSGGTVAYEPGSPANKNFLLFRECPCEGPIPPGKVCTLPGPADSCWQDGTCENKFRCWSHNDDTIALTTTSYSKKTGVIFDADIAFNSGNHFFTVVDSPVCGGTLPLSPNCVAADLQNTLTHELGHVVGLDHVLEAGSTMEANAPLGEISKRLIDPGTARGFCAIYPRAVPSPPCEDVEALDSRIIANNTGTSLAGVVGCAAAAEQGGVAAIVVAAVAFLVRPRRR